MLSALVLSDPAESSDSARWVLLTPGASVSELSRNAWLAEDPSGEWSIETAQQKQFAANTDAIINPGVSNSVLWVRFDVRNVGDQRSGWVLSLDRVLLSVADIYLQRDAQLEHLLRNDPDSFKASYRDYGTLAATISLDAEESASVYIRFRGANWSALQPFLIDQDRFQSSHAGNLALLLVLFGGVATLVFYGGISFALLGRGIVSLYAIAQLSFFAFFAHVNGATTIYLWPDNPEFGRLFSPLTVGAFIASMAQFGRLFFETSERVPKVDQVLKVAVVLALAGIALSPMDYLVPWFDRRIALYLIYIGATVSWLVLPLLAAYATLRWDRQFWPVALAWLVMSSYMITLLLVLLGVIATMPLGEQSYVIVYVEAFFIALAIALRVRAIKEDNLRAQEALNRSLSAQLEESQRAVRLAEEREWALRDLAEKGRLLLAAGHDSRQLLTALRSFSRSLRRGVDEDQSRMLAGDIDQVAEQMSSVLSTIMNGSRSGGIADSVIALQTTTISSVLAPLALIHGDAARSRNIDLRLHDSGQKLVCDSVLVTRVLSNLVSNAIKYTEPGGGLLVGCRAGGAGLRFQVWDTGTGIAAERLALLLSPQTGAARLKDDAPGTGVGLNIACELAQRMGGSISARSRPGRGSVFELVLPGTALPDLQLPVIAILEPDADQSRWLEGQVRNIGFFLQSGASLTRSGPSPSNCVVLIDQHYGGSDGGLRTAARVRADHPDIAVIIMTFDQSAAARTHLAEHADLILYKPITTAAILAAAAKLTRI